MFPGLNGDLTAFLFNICISWKHHNLEKEYISLLSPWVPQQHCTLEQLDNFYFNNYCQKIPKKPGRATVHCLCFVGSNLTCYCTRLFWLCHVVPHFFVLSFLLQHPGKCLIKSLCDRLTLWYHPKNDIIMEITEVLLGSYLQHWIDLSDHVQIQCIQCFWTIQCNYTNFVFNFK